MAQYTFLKLVESLLHFDELILHLDGSTVTLRNMLVRIRFVLHFI